MPGTQTADLSILMSHQSAARHLAQQGTIAPTIQPRLEFLLDNIINAR
jgi:hypothetical protein